MNATERQELAKQIRRQLHELKTTLEVKLPIVGNDVQDLQESEELVKRATGESQRPHYERDSTRFPEGFSHPSNIDVHTDIDMRFKHGIESLEKLLKNWIIYGETIEKELKCHQQAIQQDIERRLKGD